MHLSRSEQSALPSRKPTECQNRRVPLELYRTLMAASATKIRVALQVVPPSLSSAMAALMSLLESFTGSFLHSANLSSTWNSSPILKRPSMRPIVVGILPDVPVGGNGRFQIDWVGIAWVKMVDSRATTCFRALGPSATSGWMSIRTVLEDGGQRRKTPFRGVTEHGGVRLPAGRGEPIARRQLSTPDPCG